MTSLARLSAHSTHRPRASQHAAVDVCYSRTRGSDVNTGGGGQQQIWECKSGMIQLARPQSTQPASIISFLCCCCVPDSFRKDILPRESRLAARLLVRLPPSSPLPPLCLNNSLRPHIPEIREGFNMGNFLWFSVYQRVSQPRVIFYEDSAAKKMPKCPEAKFPLAIYTSAEERSPTRLMWSLKTTEHLCREMSDEKRGGFQGYWISVIKIQQCSKLKDSQVKTCAHIKLSKVTHTHTHTQSPFYLWEDFTLTSLHFPFFCTV